MDNLVYINFYIKNNPYFTDIKKINNSFICLNRFGKDYDNNCAFLFDDSKVLIEQYFKTINKVPAFYNIQTEGLNIEKSLTEYEVYNEDIWFVADVKKLRKKFSFIKCPASITLERVTNENYSTQNEVSRIGFSAIGSDNPYGNVDLTEYSAALKQKFDKSKHDELIIFLINVADKNVGVLNLSIENDICYIAGFTIKPEYRRTKAFFALKLVLDFLEGKHINHILCITENDGYPSKIYKKLGFEPLLKGIIYKHK